MKRWVLFIFSFLSLTKGVLGQIIISDEDQYELDGHVFMLEESPSHPLKIRDAWEKYHQGRFALAQTLGNTFSKGFVDNIHWVAIPIINTHIATRIVEAGVANNGVYHLECYLNDSLGNVLYSNTTGKRYDFFTRPIINRRYYFPLQIPPRSRVVLFFRMDYVGNAMTAPLRLMKPSYREQLESSIYGRYAFFSGLMVFAGLLSLIAFFLTKKWLYFYYGLYVLFSCLFLIGDGDLDYQWFYPHQPAWAIIAPLVYAAILLVFMLLFTTRFLQIKLTHPKLFAFVKAWLAALIVLVIALGASYSFPANITIKTIVWKYGVFCFPGAVLLQWICIAVRVKERDKRAYFYGISTIGVLFAGVVEILHALNSIPASFPPFNPLMIGFGVEFFMLSLALIYDYNDNKVERQKVAARLAQVQLNSVQNLIKTLEAERQRIAKDLHDDLGGNLAAIKIAVQDLPLGDKVLQPIVQSIDETYDSARHISHNLMPPHFNTTPFELILEKRFALFNQEGNISFEFICQDYKSNFSKEDELVIYRIVMELTTNILRHAKATEATIQLIYQSSDLLILVEDNGIGIQINKPPGKGLENVLTRVTYLSGQMRIDSSVGAGTTFIINLPYVRK